MILGKIGNGPDDIAHIWVAVDDKTKPNEWSAVYIQNNNGTLEIIRKPDDMSFAEFKKNMWQSMQNAGVRKDQGRGTVWAIYSRESGNIDFDSLDKQYESSKQLPAVINSNEKSEEETKQLLATQQQKLDEDKKEKDKENENGEKKNEDLWIKTVNILTSDNKHVFDTAISGIATAALAAGAILTFSALPPLGVGLGVASYIGIYITAKKKDEINTLQMKKDLKKLYKQEFEDMKKQISDDIKAKKAEKKEQRIQKAVDIIANKK